MHYATTITVAATREELWALIEELPALATCVPGLESFELRDPHHFDSVVRMRVGPVNARFSLSTALEDLDPPSSVVVTSEGVDRALGSRVRQHQRVELRPNGEATDVAIDLDLQLAGRIATFGQRIIAAKADEFAAELVANVEALVARRRTDRGTATTD
jgi:carbon monoxide dehydrogenase subunit G